MTLSTNELSTHIAKQLLKIEAVILRPNDPFTWASGLKAPIYCDNRLTMSYPEIRESIADGFASIIREQYPDAEVIAGTATAGIPHAAWVADKLKLPMIYVRDKAKGHGKQNLIEGKLPEGKKVVVIEDLISTGGSSIKAGLAVREAGGNVLATLAIFTYEFPQALEAFSAEGIPLQTLSSYSKLVEAANEIGAIRSEDVAVLQAWREDPQGFGK